MPHHVTPGGLFKAHCFLPFMSLDTFCDFKLAAVGSPDGFMKKFSWRGEFSTLICQNCFNLCLDVHVNNRFIFCLSIFKRI